MISSDCSTAEISNFLNKWHLNKKLVISGGLTIPKVEMDYSWAMCHSNCRTSWESVSKSKILSAATVLHLRSAHVMYRISNSIDKKFKVDTKFKK